MDCSRRGSDGSASLVHRLTLHAVCGLLVALYALGMSMPAYAQVEGEFIPAGQPIPQNIKPVQSTATGVRTTLGAMWRDVAGRATHYKLPVHVSAATLGNLGKAAVRRGVPIAGWGLLLRDLINGAGWAIDELSGQINSSPAVDQEQLVPGQFHYCVISSATQIYHCANIPGQLSGVMHLANANAAQPCTINATLPDGRVQYRCMNIPTGQQNYNVSELRVQYPVTPPATPWENANPPATPAVEATPEALGQLIKDHPQVTQAVMIDPVTDAPIRTPEVVQALNDLRRSLEALNGLPPGTDLAPSNDFSISTPSQTPWPEFCGWAKRVCDWMFDLEPEPENPDLPYAEIDPTEMEEFDIGLGQGTCPAPYTTSVLDGEFEIQWDGLCGFVEYLRPLMIGLAWVVAAFIVANAAKRA